MVRQRASVHEIVERAGKVEPANPAEGELIRLGDGAWGRQTVTATQSLSFNCIYGGALQIWPGELLSLHDPGMPADLVVPRAPITLSVGGQEAVRDAATGERETEHRTLRRVVQAPTRSTVRQAILALTKDIHDYPATVMSSMSRVSSQRQLKLHMTGGVGYAGAQVNASLDWSSTKTRDKLMFSYQQPYYTIDVDELELPEGFFPKSVDRARLEQTLCEGSRPAYVSSVTYGVRAWVVIESDLDETSLRTAIDASYGGSGVTANLKAKAEAESTLRKCRMDAYISGGAAGQLAPILGENAYDGLKKVLTGSLGAPSSAPAPMSFSLVNLLDGTPVSVVVATSQIVLPVSAAISSIKLIGTPGDVQLDRALIWASPSGLAEVPLVAYYNKKWVTMHLNSTISPQAEWTHLDIPVPDGETSGLAGANLKIRATVRDWARRVWAEGTDTVWGENILGDHTFTIETPAPLLKFEVTYSVRGVEEGPTEAGTPAKHLVGAGA